LVSGKVGVGREEVFRPNGLAMNLKDAIPRVDIVERAFMDTSIAAGGDQNGREPARIV
jgi:hypothetical protein